MMLDRKTLKVLKDGHPLECGILASDWLLGHRAEDGGKELSPQQMGTEASSQCQWRFVQ